MGCSRPQHCCCGFLCCLKRCPSTHVLADVGGQQQLFLNLCYGGLVRAAKIHPRHLMHPCMQHMHARRSQHSPAARS
jgi:hypothetical protein